MTQQSPTIGKLAEALAAAQGEITGARKDSSNPFFKSKYADLASVWDACREHLSKNGLSVIQTTYVGQRSRTETEIFDQKTERTKKETSEVIPVVLVTMLAHSSGEWIQGVLEMLPKDNSPQAIGSCISYARRYALSAIVGVAQVDDDANSATR